MSSRLRDCSSSSRVGDKDSGRFFVDDNKDVSKERRMRTTRTGERPSSSASSMSSSSSSQKVVPRQFARFRTRRSNGGGGHRAHHLGSSSSVKTMGAREGEVVVYLAKHCRDDDCNFVYVENDLGMRGLLSLDILDWANPIPFRCFLSPACKDLVFQDESDFARHTIDLHLFESHLRHVLPKEKPFRCPYNKCQFVGKDVRDLAHHYGGRPRPDDEGHHRYMLAKLVGVAVTKVVQEERELMAEIRQESALLEVENMDLKDRLTREKAAMSYACTERERQLERELVEARKEMARMEGVMRSREAEPGRGNQERSNTVEEEELEKKLLSVASSRFEKVDVSVGEGKAMEDKIVPIANPADVMKEMETAGLTRDMRKRNEVRVDKMRSVATALEEMGGERRILQRKGLDDNMGVEVKDVTGLVIGYRRKKFKFLEKTGSSSSLPLLEDEVEEDGESGGKRGCFKKE